jgi:YhcH/YjgK/YiaL family protein
MTFGHLDRPETYRTLLELAAFRQAIAWLRRIPAEQPQGIFELAGRDMFVNVHGYDTLPREECRFESHRRYVDLQYCIRGGELIDSCFLGTITRPGKYDPETDFIFHEPPPQYSSLRLAPGDFAVFFPEDVHRPKVHDGRNRSVDKLVIKIACTLFSPST